MIRIKLRFAYDRRARALLIISFLLGLLLLGASFVLERPGDVQASSAAAFIPGGGGRHFYLTDANYYTDQALTACASGYHMASLWEILDVSNLTYDYDHPARTPRPTAVSGRRPTGTVGCAPARTALAAAPQASATA